MSKASLNEAFATGWHAIVACDKFNICGKVIVGGILNNCFVLDLFSGQCIYFLSFNNHAVF